MSTDPGTGPISYPRSFGLFYDFRNPEPWRQPWATRYAELLEQIAWVDASLPFAEISLSEHHFVEDGYSPSVLALAAAVAVRTSRVGIVTNILQLPLHHPLRVAEDSLTVDILSGGRFRLGVAAGYREVEFEALGTRTRDRGERMDESLAILRMAFSGEKLYFEGRHWQIPEVRVTPGPIRDGGPEIWLGGRAPKAIERAAVHGDGFLASQNADVTAYLDARRRLGHVDAPPRTARTARMVIAPDPDKALAELGPFLLHQVNQYVEFGFLATPPYTDARDLLRDGHYEIVDAAGAREAFARAGAAGVDELHLMAVLPGETVASGSARLDYVAHQVLPHLHPARGAS